MKPLHKKIIILAVSLTLLAIVAFKDRSFDITSIRVDESFTKTSMLNTKKPALVNLGADNCISCFDMFNDLVELNNELSAKVIIKFIDVIKQEKQASEFSYSSVPTQIFYNNGKIYMEHAGKMSREEILLVFKEMGVEID